MLEKTIKWKDFDGNDREETFYFHMNSSEVVEWIVSTGNYTLDKVLLRISEQRNARDIVETFKDLIRRSHGRKSLDGRRFEKNDEIWNDFYQTEAYSQMFMELINDAKKASDFFNAIIPEDLSAKLNEIMKENPDSIPDYVKDYINSNKSVPGAATIVPMQ